MNNIHILLVYHSTPATQHVYTFLTHLDNMFRPKIQLKGCFKSLVPISQYYDFWFPKNVSQQVIKLSGKEFSGTINKFNVSEFLFLA